MVFCLVVKSISGMCGKPQPHYSNVLSGGSEKKQMKWARVANEYIVYV